MRPKKIVITGKIGSGKSSFVEILKKNNDFEFRSADIDAKNIIANNIDYINSIVKNIYGREIDYKQVFFENKLLKKQIEDFVYEKLYKDYANLVSNKDIFFEIPLYFESLNLAQVCGFTPDEVVYINVDKDIRYKRLKENRIMAENEIIARDQYFVSDEFAIKNSDVIIDNNEDLQKLQERIKDYLDKKY